LERYAGTAKTFLYLLQNFGPAYFYRGLDAKLLQTIVTAGFMFLTYERISEAIFSAFGLKKSHLGSH